MKRVCAAAIAFTILGCGGGGSNGDDHIDTTCVATKTDTALFDAADYAGQRASVGDPLSAYQWHLKSFGQKTGNGNYANAIKGHDLNVVPVWNSGYTGRGVTIAIVDTGVDSRHPDLAPNLNRAASYDLDPVSKSDECAHGTMTAGIAAAAGGNGGMIGVAPNAEIIGINIFSSCGRVKNKRTAAFQSNSLTPKKKTIFSNSWGCTKAFEDCASAAARIAIQDGATKGSIYVFAAGNERDEGLRSDYSEHQNLFEVLPVAALLKDSTFAPYSNPGANLLISAYGGDHYTSHALIATTDTLGCNAGRTAAWGAMQHILNENAGYTTKMNGTSAATPMVSGVIALMLEARPALTFREIRYILAKTARKNDAGDSEWKLNGAGFPINHNYGFGLIDAQAAVQEAKGFSLFPALKTEQFNIGSGASVSSTIDKIEFVNLELTMSGYSGCNLDISLTSPSETNATFVDKNYQLKSNDLNGVIFGTPRFLDENPDGTWQVTIDKGSCATTPTLTSAKITIKGRQ